MARSAAQAQAIPDRASCHYRRRPPLRHRHRRRGNLHGQKRRQNYLAEALCKGFRRQDAQLGIWRIGAGRRSRVIGTPGGKDNTIVALDKNNGEKVSGAAVGDAAGYASVIKATIDGVDQYINLTQNGVISVRAKDGKLLWRYNHGKQDGQLFGLHILGQFGICRQRLRKRRRSGRYYPQRRRIRSQRSLLQQKNAKPSRRRAPPRRHDLRLQQSTRSHLFGF